MTIAEKKWTKNIHTAKNQLHLDDDSYRAILLDSAGVSSAKDIATWAQYGQVMAAFKKLGFTVRVKDKKPDTSPRNPDWITARQEYYIRGLWSLASRVKDESSLRAMVKRIAHVDDIRFIKKADAASVILALRDITAKAGYNPNSGGE